MAVLIAAMPMMAVLIAAMPAFHRLHSGTLVAWNVIVLKARLRVIEDLQVWWHARLCSH